MAESNMAAENESYVVPVQSSDEMRQRYLNLYRAASKGNWDIAKVILKMNPDDIWASISKVGDTVLHVAARASHEYFIKVLVEGMKVTPKDLREKNVDQNTAFCLAVMSGNMEIVKFMMSRDCELVKIKGENDMLPLQIAARLGHKKIVDHLYRATKHSLENQNRIDLLVALIDNHLYEQDFLWSLPAKLLLGLFTLFILVLGMMVVFCTTFFIVFHEGTMWPAAPAVVLAFVPVIMFILQHTRLFLDVVRLMSSSNCLFQENRRNFLLFKGKQLKEEL